MRRWGKSTLDEIIGSLLFFALAGAAAFSLSCLMLSENTLRYGKARSDFLLMTVQSALALAGMALPKILDRKLHLHLSAGLYAMFYGFLFCAVFLGEMLSFYYRLAQWDTLLHFFSGVMLTLLGVHLAERTGIRLPLYAVALFAFCFSLALGALWESYEYVMDGLLHMNMQKFSDDRLRPFSGREALRDTMQDLLVDAFSGAVTAGVWFMRRRKRGN